MKINNESNRDIRDLEYGSKLSIEIENIDKANKRKKQALRQQAKAIKRLNEENQALKKWIERLLEDEEQRDDWAEIEREKEEWGD